MLISNLVIVREFNYMANNTAQIYVWNWRLIFSSMNWDLILIEHNTNKQISNKSYFPLIVSCKPVNCFLKPIAFTSQKRDNYQRKIYLLNVLLMIPLFFKTSRMERVKSLASGEGNITLAKLSIFRISHQATIQPYQQITKIPNKYLNKLLIVAIIFNVAIKF